MRPWPLILLGLALASGANAVAAPPPVPKGGVPEMPGRVAPHVAGVVRIAAAGDVACPPGEKPEPRRCRQVWTGKLVEDLNPAAVIALGDLQYYGGAWADFKASYDKSWGKFKAKTKPVIGNHEYQTPGANGYYTYFGRKPHGYYAKTIGSWRLYVLNSNCNRINCARELTWLSNQLKANPTTCSAIAMHHPRYSSGVAGSTSAMAPFFRVAYRHRVDLALAGHDHNYERFAPMDGDFHLRADGIASFVVGTGGKSLRSMGREERGSRYFRADRFGVLMLSLGRGEYSWSFRTPTGEVRDPGRRSCHVRRTIDHG